MLEIGRSLAILEVGPFLDDQLDKVGVFGKKTKIGRDGPSHPLQAVGDSHDAPLDPLIQLDHNPISRGQEEFALARKMAIKRPFSDLKPIRQDLGDRIRKALLGEQLRGGLQDLLPPGRDRFLVAAPSSASSP